MTDDDHFVETDTIVAELELAGLITVLTYGDGKPVHQVTSKGTRTAHQIAMTDED